MTEIFSICDPNMPLDFFAGTRNSAIVQQRLLTILRGILHGILRGILRGCRTDLGGRDRLQRNDGTEQIPFDKLRYSARIQLGIFIGVAHTRAEFVSKGYLAEHLCDRWVLRNGLMRKLSAKGLTFPRSLAGNINEIIIK